MNQGLSPRRGDASRHKNSCQHLNLHRIHEFPRKARGCTPRAHARLHSQAQQSQGFRAMTVTDINDPNPRSNSFDGARDGKSLKAATRKARETASSLLHDRVDPLVDRAKTYADDARLQAGRAFTAVTDTAKRKPGTTALVALGAGVALGAILALALRRPAGQVGGSIRQLSGDVGAGLKDRAGDLSDQIRGLLRR